MGPLLHEKLTESIIGAAIEVHRELGPGLLESAYEECLCQELRARRHVFEWQVPLPVVYKGVKLDCGYRMDVVVEDLCKAAVDEGLLQDILGVAERGLLYDLSHAVIRGDARRCVELVAGAVVQGRDLSRLSRDLVEHFRNLLVVRLAAEKTASNDANDLPGTFGGQLLDLPDQEIADLRAQVEDLSVETLLDYFDFMAAGDEDVARSANPRFALESALIGLATLPKTLPISELLERLEEIDDVQSVYSNADIPDSVYQAA